MKLDLTNLTRAAQVQAVGEYLAVRTESANGRKTMIYVSDLMERFKNRTLKTQAARLKWFGALIADVYAEANARKAASVAAKVSEGQCPSP